jgi:hypothetical protein
MDTVEEPKKESGSTAVASHCENCEVWCER